MSNRVSYAKPSRLNSVTVTLLLLAVAGGYWMWRFFPAYFDAWSVDHLLKEASSTMYRLNRLKEPMRTNEMKATLDKLRADIIKKGNVTDPDLDVQLEIDGNLAAVSANYSLTVVLAPSNKKVVLNFHRKETANVKAVNWD